MGTMRGIRPLLILFIAAMMLATACTAQYTLTTSVSPEGAGSITPASGTYDGGTEATLTAESASGYRFDHWSGDATGTSSSVTITMDSAKSVTAYFKAQYTLTTLVSPGGAGTVSPASGNYDEGAEVTLTAAAAEGYIFDHWNSGATGTSVTITMDSEKSLTAYFKVVLTSEDIWEVKVVSVQKSKTVNNAGQGVIRWWTASEGYLFLSVEVQFLNLSAEEQEFDSSSITVTDSENQFYSPYGFVEVGFGLYDLSTDWTITIAGHGGLSRNIVCIVPDTAEDFYFQFLDLPEIYLGQ